jgi:ATP10 protein
MTFPTVKGSNLLREKLTLPHDFQGKFNLIFIPFEQWQQMEVDSWMALAKELEERFDRLRYYELPTIQNRNSFYKMFINEGMRAGIPNPKTRERTVTLYLDKADFRAALGMSDEEHIYVLVVDQQGNEFFRARGPYSREGEAALRQALLRLNQKTQE